jgi:hypothetical protein
MARPLTVTVATGGADTSIPTGPQFGANFAIVGPDGTRVAFNDPTDVDYVGMLTDISGFDAPDLRESADDLVQQDGGIHGDFFYGRRPVTLSGMILNPASADDRNRKMTRMMRACRALRSDATISWVLSGGYEQYIRVRLQNGPRFQGNWQKEFMVGMVAADPRIYSTTLNSTFVPLGGSATLTNNGNAWMYPNIAIYGPVTNPTLRNFTTGESINIIYTLVAGQFLALDVANHTVLLNGTTSLYSSVDLASTSWWALAPGANDIRSTVYASSAGAGITVEYRDTWM